MDWSKEIRQLMTDRDWSVRQFAKKVEMSASYISDVTNGKPASPMLKLKVLDMRGYDLASAAVLRMLLPKDVAEELVQKEKMRAKILEEEKEYCVGAREICK
jgi:transcriptional regulator with XRE-family HTH domain